ncbi:MAG: Type 3 secretion system secretin [Holosporales bacterium]
MIYIRFCTIVVIFFTLISGCTDIRTKSVDVSKKDHPIQEILDPVENTPESPPALPIFTPLKKEKEIPKSLLKPVSISISEKTPLKQVLIALSEQAKVDLQLDPSIEGAIVYTAQKRPFYTVMKNICDMAKLRLVIDGDSIKIEPDRPYSKNYNLQFLNIERNSNNRISIATDVFSSMNTVLKTDTSDNSSNSEVKMLGKNSFWQEVEENIKTILQNSDQTGHFAIHKQAGLISIHATQKQHDLIYEYITMLKRVSSRQVLIEAKIIEIQLKDNYKSGINWQQIQDSGFYLNANFSQLSSSSPFLNKAFQDTQSASIGRKGTFSAILGLLQEFGTSKTLSSPRLTVMNNQIAVLKVAQNSVYFKLNYDKQITSGANSLQNLSLSSDVQTVPIGLVMSVQPSIDEETGDIILCLRPTISKLSTSVQDPAVNIAFAQSTNGSTSSTPSNVPVVDVKEIDSVLRVKSGEIAILGGLMEVRSTSDKAGLPGGSDVPFVKDLFSAQAESDQVIEQVILLKATIVDQPTPDLADRRLAKKYIKDSRSL